MRVGEDRSPAGDHGAAQEQREQGKTDEAELRRGLDVERMGVLDALGDRPLPQPRDAEPARADAGHGMAADLAHGDGPVARLLPACVRRVADALADVAEVDARRSASAAP